MLIEFSVKNYKSFKQKCTFSMVTGADKRLKKNVIAIDSIKPDLIRSAAIYGANASGKSNFVQALNFVESFVINSVDRAPNAKISVKPFAFDAEMLKAPSEFEVIFIHQHIRYQYGFILDTERIYEEWLIAYPKGFPQTWYERVYDEESDEYHWEFSKLLKGEKFKLTPLTRHNALFLSTAAKFNHEQLVPVFNWFQRHLNVLPPDMPKDVLEFVTSTMVLSNEKLQKLIQQLLMEADLGIADFTVTKKEKSRSSLLEYPVGMPDEVRDALDILAGASAGSDELLVSIAHKVEGDSTVLLDLRDESLGTRRLYGLSGVIFTALDDGDVLVIDELAANLHPLLVRALVNLFNDPHTNPKNAQLIFNTHDTSLLDPTLLRRDQIWFVEKNHEGATELYALLEFKTRSTEAFERGYLQGRYGAIPVLGDWQGFFADA
ncbi:MAG TPA: ATP-binding protein [Anaerolineae bacterium]|nr:ATP-binding protein [Anaerolineae bacterium]